MKKLVLLFMTFLSLISFGKVEKLYVGTNAEFYPFEYLEDGKIVGFDAELIEAIGKKLNKEIVWKNMAFDGLLPALQSKKIEVNKAEMTATTKRKIFDYFTDK